MKKVCLLLVVSLVGCGPSDTASIPSEYGTSQQPAKPPAMTSGTGQPEVPPPPSMNP